MSKDEPRDSTSIWILEVVQRAPSLNYISALAHLSLFGILGACIAPVLIRYGLEQLFGPRLAQVTSFSNALYIDLPANMAGSFFMGLVGLVLKERLMNISEELALGLSTGLMGSITTFAAWSQSMLKLITSGHWAQGLCGFLLGMELAQVSLLVAIDIGNMLFEAKGRAENVDMYRNISLYLCVPMSICVWLLAIFLMLLEKSNPREKLWIGCVLAPFGVWIRWWLSNLNGRAIGSHLKWFPWGTFLANVVSSIAEFILSIVQLYVNNAHLIALIGGTQFGLLGCMSTVSTFVTEIHILSQQQQHKWRPYLYASTTIFVTLLCGILTYSTPIWTLGSINSGIPLC